MKDLVDLLIKKNISLSSCESFTGGLFASSLTSIPGVSKVFKGSIIAYQSDVKKNLLHINEQIFADYGVISDKMALEMAIKTKLLLNTDICVSFTGNAGPNCLENKDVGVWFMAIVYKDLSFVYEYCDKGSREMIRMHAVSKAIENILNIVRNN